MSPLGATWRCDQCRKQVRGMKHTTMLGRTVCTACQDRQASMVLGGQMAQQQGGEFVTNAVADTIAVAGARSWIRRALGRDREESAAQPRSRATEPAPPSTDASRAS
jgi:hypothetical protein